MSDEIRVGDRFKILHTGSVFAYSGESGSTFESGANKGKTFSAWNLAAIRSNLASGGIERFTDGTLEYVGEAKPEKADGSIPPCQPPEAEGKANRFALGQRWRNKYGTEYVIDGFCTGAELKAKPGREGSKVRDTESVILWKDDGWDPVSAFDDGHYTLVGEPPRDPAVLYGAAALAPIVQKRMRQALEREIRDQGAAAPVSPLGLPGGKAKAGETPPLPDSRSLPGAPTGCTLITRSGLPCDLVAGHLKQGKPCTVLPNAYREGPKGVSDAELAALAAGPWRKRGAR